LTHSERKMEWLGYLKWSQPLNGLLAILENDGEKMLADVLKELKIGTPVELVKWAKEKGA
jgi:hypothetical protein